MKHLIAATLACLIGLTSLPADAAHARPKHRTAQRHHASRHHRAPAKHHKAAHAAHAAKTGAAKPKTH